MKLLIIANWKCNPTNLNEAKKLYLSIRKGIKSSRKREVVICPPFIYLPELLKLSSGKKKIKFGAQNCFWEERGAFTGEISIPMLKSFGCEYVIIGHSERRRIFRETEEMINKKIKAALASKIKPILCVGEDRKERERGEIGNVFKRQIKSAFMGISKLKIRKSKICLAYEPLWAIGTGNPCRPDEAMSAKLLIKKILISFLGRSTAEQIPLLYGGSVNSKNVSDFIKEAGMQGVLVGGASLKAEEFVKIVNCC